MVRQGVLVLLLVLFQLTTFGQTAPRKDLASYVGGSSCAPELSENVGVYGIRLDKAQRAYLSAHTLDNTRALMIVQYAAEGDRCGTIKDVVQSKNKSNYFEFECEDHRQPSAVVVGTWPSKSNAAQGPAVEGWRISLSGLKFVPLKSRVTCIRRSGEDSEDEGDDLATWARNRTIKKKEPVSRQR